MKKFLLFLFLGIFTAAIPMKAAEEVGYTCLFGSSYNSKSVSSYENSWSATNDNFTWNITNANNNSNGWDFIRMGSKNNALTGTITTATAIPEKVTKIDLTISTITVNNVTSITLKTSKTNSFSSPIETQTFTKAQGTQTVTLSSPQENLYYEISISTSKSSNGVIQIGKVEYYIEKNGGDSEDNKPVDLTTFEYSASKATWDLASTTNAELPSLTIVPSDENLSLTYTSENSSVASVDDTGKVTPLAVGQTTIKASFAGNEKYNANEASYTLTVTKTTSGGEDNPGGESGSYTIEFKTADDNNGNVQFSTSSIPSDVLENGSEYVSAFTDASLAFTTGIAGARIGQNKNDGKLEFTLTDAGKVKPTKIEVLISGNNSATLNIATNLNLSGQNFSVTKYADTYTTAQLTFEEGTLEKFIFSKTGSNIAYIKSITVYYQTEPEEAKEYTALNNIEPITLGYNGTKTLSLGTSHPSLTFSTNPTGVVTVDNTTGLITAITKGTKDETTIVTAEWGDEDGKWVVPETFPTFTVNVNKIVQKDYTAPFDGQEYTFTRDENDTTIEVGEEHPELSFAYNPEGVVTIDNNGKVTLKGIGTTKVTATWGDKFYNDGEATFTVIVTPAPEDPGLSFRYSTVYGKADVGFVGQAVYHTSPGAITYTSSNPEVVDVDPTTGMYVSGKPCNEGTTTITATIEACDGYKAGSASYVVIIEKNEDEVAAEPATATFDFHKKDSLHSEDSFTYPTSTANATQSVDGVRFTDGKVTVVAIKNKEFTGTQTEPRLYYGTGQSLTDVDYRIYKNNIMTISVPEDNSINSIVFTLCKHSSSSSSTGLSSVYGSVSCSTSNLEKTVNIKDENVNEIVFTCENPIVFEKIVVNINANGSSTGKTHYALSFNDEDRIINSFVDDIVTLPELQYADGFDKTAKVTYSIDDEGDDKGDMGSEDGITINDSTNPVTIEGLKEGVYTIRATSEPTETQTASTAILRLNVFPHLPVVASDEHLADDERTEAPNLNLVNTTPESDEYVKVNLPVVPDDPHYSTIHIQRVEVNNGGVITIYEVKDNSEPEDVRAKDAQVKDMSEMEESFEFKADGYVSYTLRYADTYEIEETIHVIFMPEKPTVSEIVKDNPIEITPSKDAYLQYGIHRMYTHGPTIAQFPEGSPFNANDGVKAMSHDGSEAQWFLSDKNETVQIAIPDDLKEDESLAVTYRSVKNLEGIVADDVDPVLASEPDAIAVNSEGSTTGIDSVTGDDTDANGRKAVYNLQGVRVYNPTPGNVYIVVDGKKAVKVTM